MSARVLFVCQGNICRSPMAEFVLKHLAARRHLAEHLIIESCGVSDEERGNPPHPGTLRVLAAHGVPVAARAARPLRRADYAAYDYLVGMEARNTAGILRICGSDPDGKVSRLLDCTAAPRDIADPWYTGDFESTYRDVLAGCEALLASLIEKGGL